MGKQRRLIGARATEKDTPRLLITPMIDMFTILLVFLLMSYGVTQVQIRQSDDLQLPESTARINPELAVSIVISKVAIYVDNKKIVDLKDFHLPREARDKGSGYLITPLFQELQIVANKAKAIVKRSERGELFEGNVVLQGDRDVPFTLLRDVMYTAGQAEYSNFRFLVLKRNQA